MLRSSPLFMAAPLLVSAAFVLATACRETPVAPLAPNFSLTRPYRIIDLGTPGISSGARGINPAGQVIGTMDVGGQEHAFLWDRGTTIDLGTLGAEHSEAYAINPAGQVVGCTGGRDGPHSGFLWEHGAMMSLDPLPGDLASCAYEINPTGQVVGVSGLPGPWHAVLWDRGTVTDLGLNAYPEAINPMGQVVGVIELPGGQFRSFLWDRGTMTDLGNLGSTFTAVSAINSQGQIVGWGVTASRHFHAFLWERGTMTDLGTLGGTYSQAVAINSAGQVVGHSTTADGEIHAFFWDRGTMTDIGTFGGDYSDAVAINQSGAVLGMSTLAGNFGEDGPKQHPFVWKSGTMIDLGTLGGDFRFEGTEVVAINPSGQVVGTSRPAEGPPLHAVLWTP